MNKLVQLEYGERCPLCRSILLHSIDDEVVCSRCGAVLGYSSDNPIQCNRSVEPNLYSTFHVGSVSHPMDASRSLHYNRNTNLSLFSNLCERLLLPRHVALECWMYYSKLLKGIKMGSAELAMLVVHTVCKRYSLQRSQEEIRDAVALVYARRCLPTLQKVLSNFANEVYGCRDAKMIELYMQFFEMDDRSRKRAMKILSIINGLDLKRVMDIAC